MGEGALRCSLNLSSKVLADSPMYSSSHSVLPHLYQYMMLLFFFHFFFVFGKHQQIFQCVSSPEVCLDPITCCKLICNSHIDLWCMVSLCDIFFVWMVSSFLFYSFYLPDLFITLWKAHLGYLHLSRALSRWFNSSLSSCGVEQTAFALCVRVLTTLNLQARL